MSNRRKAILIVFLLLPVLLLGSFLLLYNYTRVVDRALLSLINHRTQPQFTVQFENLSGNLINRISIENLRISGQNDTLNCSRLSASYSLLNLLRGRLQAEELLVDSLHARLYLSGDSAGSSSSGSSPSLDSLLRELPAFSIGHLGIRGGEVELHPAGRVQRFQEIDLDLSARASADTLSLDVARLTGKWAGEDFEVSRTEFKFGGRPGSLFSQSLNTSGSGFAIAESGQLRFSPQLWLQVVTDSARIDLPLLRKLWPDLPVPAGALNLGIAFSGTPEEFSAQVAINGELDGKTLDQLDFQVLASGHDYHINDLRLRSSAGNLNGSAELQGSTIKSASLNFSRLDLAALNLGEQHTHLNGSLQFVLTENRWPQLSGSGSLRLENSDLGYARLSKALLRLQAENGAWKIIQPSEIEFSPAARFAVQGALSAERFINARITTENTSIDSLARFVDIGKVKGAATLDIQVQGRLANPSVNGTLYLDSLSYGNTTVYGVDGSVEIENLLRNRKGSFDLEIATGFVGDIFLTSGNIHLKIVDDKVVFSPMQFYSEENSILSQGVLEFGRNELRLVLPRFDVTYEKYQIRNKGVEPAEVHFRNDTLYVDHLALVTSDSGSVVVKGFLAINQQSSLLVDLSNIRLQPISQYLYLNYKLKGNIDSQLEIAGPMEAPQFNWFFSLNDLYVNEQRVGKMNGEFFYKDDQFGINFLDFERDSTSYLTLNGSVDFALREDKNLSFNPREVPLDLNIALSNFRLQDYAFLINTTYPVEGAFSGRIDLKGNLANPRGSAELSGSRLKIADYEFPYFSLSSHFDRDTVFVDTATINFMNTELRVSGWKDIRWDPGNLDTLLSRKGMFLNLAVDEDSLNLLNSLNPDLDRLIGNIHIRATLEGDYDAPEVRQAKVKVHEGTLFLSKIENGIQNLEFEGHLDGQRFLIDQFSARSLKREPQRNFLQRWVHSLRSLFFRERKRGFLSGSGSVDLSELRRPRYNLQLKMDHAYFNYFLENTEVVVSSNNLKIAGRDTIDVEGHVVVNEGVIEVDFAESEKNLLLTTTVRENPPFLRYNLDTEILPRFYVRNQETLNNFDLKLSGDLRIIQEPRGLPEMIGALQTEGKYFVQGEDFNIRSGKIEYVNPKELPQVNLFAQKQKNNLLFGLTVHGPIDAPEKEISIQDENGNTLAVPDVKDQLSLLLFGVYFNELGSGTESLLLSKGEQVVSQTVFATIEKEARSFTGLDQVRLDAQVNFFSSRLNQPTTLALGKYLTSNLYLEYKSLLSSGAADLNYGPEVAWEAGNQIYLEYRLNRNWSFTSTFQRSQEGNERVKLDISWRVEF